MDEFYTVPDAIIFRNIQTLGQNQSRTLLLQNKSQKEIPVFVSLPFTRYFSLECHDPSQEQSSPACLITKVPPRGSAKVVIKLHTPPNLDEVDNLHDCLVAVFGKVPLLVPLRAVKQQLDPVSSGQGLQAVLSQLPFEPPQDQLDAHCDAFVVELASRLQLELGLQVTAPQTAPPHHHPPVEHPEAKEQQGSPLGTRTNAQAGPPLFLPPDTFSQAPPPLSNSSDEDSPSQCGLPVLPQLNHQVIIKGRTAFATRIPGAASASLQRQNSRDGSRSLAALQPGSCTSSQPLAPSSIPSAEEPALTNAAPPLHHCHTSLTSLLPSEYSAVPRGGMQSSLGHMAMQQTGPIAAHLEFPGKRTQRARARQSSSGSSSRASNDGGYSGSSQVSANNQGSFSGSGSMRTGPVFMLGGRCYNARGEEVEPQAGAITGHLPRQTSAHDRSATLVSAMCDLGVHDLPAPRPPPPAAKSWGVSSGLQPPAQAPLPRQLSGCLTQLDLPRMPYQAASCPPIHGSSSSAAARAAAARAPGGSHNHLAAAGGSPHSILGRQAAPGKQAAAAAAPSLPAKHTAPGRQAAAAVPAPPAKAARPARARSVGNRLDDSRRGTEDDVEGGLLCALEAHIAQHFGHIGENHQADGGARPASASSTGSGRVARAKGGSGRVARAKGGTEASVHSFGRDATPLSRPEGLPEKQRPVPGTAAVPGRKVSRGGEGMGHAQNGSRAASVSMTAASSQQQQELSRPARSNGKSALRGGGGAAGESGQPSRGNLVRAGSKGRRQGSESEDDGEGFADSLALAIEKHIEAQGGGSQTPSAEVGAGKQVDLTSQQTGSLTRHHAAAAAAVQRVRDGHAR